METRICDERHKRIDEKFKAHNRKNDNYEIRITDLEKSDAAMSEKMLGLISQLGALNTTLKWFIGLMVGAFVSFFFYAVQQGLFK